MPRQMSQSYPLADLPGISADVLHLLCDRGLVTTLDLLHEASSRSAQQQLARSLQLRDQEIMKPVAMADLARVPAIGTRYCGLVLHCGVYSVQQLAQAHPGQLHRHVLRFQVALLQQKDHCPTLVHVMQWIQQAKQLQPI
ncbi:DUF4332 domain-containing protein [Lyngbya confervoides]|uniref:DUF4332 domain-containing protein n=1 Tax=Lyngbya confervoides BDU141951 TaxID=1574623 RepID=A0ABD4T3P6_9CYAN|nr:DUF4332 domain-containing protein [Lyngbya confervoides]MCM1983189.1 DUF4332 domain-containing protein [Lyngbya confervoides BDU141951]